MKTLGVLDRVKKAWNAFSTVESFEDVGYSVGTPSFTAIPPSMIRPIPFANERTIISALYARMSVDVAAVDIRHIKVDEAEQFVENVKSHLNTCLTLEPNIDQGPRSFKQDIVLTLFERGVAAIVPVDTTRNASTNEVVDILTLRVGEIVSWYPEHVKVSVFNVAKGVRQEILIEKKNVAIVHNPLYTVMNAPNSTLQRLIRKLNLLDAVDEASSSGKLDIIIQLPYVIKSDARRAQAERRRDDIEFQLKGSKYGIAYTDGTEKIMQLNRPAENNLLGQIEFLTKMLYDQLGITAEVMNGTASQDVMTNYFDRTVEPVVEAIKEAIQRSFIGHAGTDRMERIVYYKDLFKLIPFSELAEVIDKLTRNEVMTGNEIRTTILGIKPSVDPKADQLRNSNMPQSDTEPAPPAGPSFEEMDAVMEEVLGGFEKQIEDLAKRAGNG